MTVALTAEAMADVRAAMKELELVVRTVVAMVEDSADSSVAVMANV